MSVLVVLILAIAAVSFSAQAATEKTSGNFKYVVLSNGTVEITEYNSTFTSSVTIPSKLDGKTVSSIGQAAFQYHHELKTVVIPNTVKSIGHGAFMFCGSLTSVNLPSSVTKLGSYVFEGCSALSKITFPSSLTSVGMEVISGTAYEDNEANWKNGALYVGSWLVQTRPSEAKGAYSVKDGTVGIAEDMFSYCDEITSFNIPASVKYITGNYILYNCEKLTKVTVASGNTSFCAVDGVLYNKAKTMLIKYPRAKSGSSFAVPGTVKSISQFAFGGCSQLKKVTLAEGLTTIGDYAFVNCDGLESMNFPNSVTKIGSYTFRACPALKSVTMPSKLTEIPVAMFSACTKLAEINIPNGVKKIGANAFEGCSTLTSVTIPDSVTEIGDSAFDYCTSLVKAKLPSGLKVIRANLFNQCENLTTVNFPSGLTEIESYAFAHTAITELNLPASAKTVGDYAFYWAKLKKISLPEGMTTIGFRTFSGTYIEELNLPSTIKIIGYGAFSGTSITELTLPNGVTDIYPKAFDGCRKLVKVTMPNSVKEIGENAFEGCASLKEIKLSENITRIPEWCFRYCERLEKIVIPDRVTSIDEFAFANCYKLSDVKLPKNLKTIGDHAFGTCASLTSIDLPDTIEHIGDLAFVATEITSPHLPKNIKSMGYNPFREAPFSDAQDKAGIYWGNWLIGYEFFPYAEGETKITIKDGTVGIANFLFAPYVEGSYPYYIKTLNIPNTVKYIGTRAFATSYIKNLVIPDSVTYIGDEAFYGCQELEKVTLSKNLKVLSKRTFVRCYALKNINIPDSLESMGENVFMMSGMLDGQTGNIKYVGNWIVNANYNQEKLVIKDGVVGICDYAFLGYTKDVTVPKSVKHIGKCALGYGGGGGEIGKTNIRNFKMHCYPNSAALTYAKNNGLAYSIICPKHNYVLTATKNATCTVNGSKTYKCTVCGGVKTETIAKKGHKYVKTVTKATTSKDGKIVSKCSVCKTTVTAKIAKVSKISLSSTKYTYNGKVRKPGVTIKTADGKILKNGTDYTVSYSKGRKNVGKYTVKITFKGNYSGTKTLTFTINPKPVKLVSLGTANKKMTVQWKKETKQTTGYEIQYSTSSKFKSGTKTVTVKKNKTTSTKISGLKSGKKYYVRIRTYKVVDGKKYYSSWSSKMSIKVG